MGLDMYLNGKAFLWTDWDKPENNLQRDGYRVREITLELGYWRKHPDLHGYIVETFAKGVDNCEEINLTAENMIQIIAAIKDRQLPHTEGFFFGASDGSEDKATIEIFLKAIKWLEGVAALRMAKNVTPLGRGMVVAEIDVETVKTIKESREVVYRASW